MLRRCLPLHHPHLFAKTPITVVDQPPNSWVVTKFKHDISIHCMRHVEKQSNDPNRVAGRCLQEIAPHALDTVRVWSPLSSGFQQHFETFHGSCSAFAVGIVAPKAAGLAREEVLDCGAGGRIAAVDEVLWHHSE